MDRAPLVALLVIPLACAGGSSGSAGDTDSATDSSTTTATTGTTDATGTSSATDSGSGSASSSASGSTGGGATSGATDTSTGTAGSGSTGGAGSTGGSTGGAQPVDVPFSVVADFVQPEYVAEGQGTELFTSEAEYMAYFGAPSPASLDLSQKWALLTSVGLQPVPGHMVSTDTLTLTGTELAVDATHRSPGTGCFTLEYELVASQLVSFDPLGVTPTTFPLALGATSFDCETDGGVDSAQCTALSLCGKDLVCAGITRSTQGLCLTTSNWGVFDGTAGSNIPDNDANGLVRTANASGLATVDMDVVVRIAMDHPSPSDLLITITNPSSNEVTVWDHEDAPAGAFRIDRAPVGFSGDESVNGTWTLKVADDVAGNAGSFAAWHVELVSRLD